MAENKPQQPFCGDHSRLELQNNTSSTNLKEKRDVYFVYLLRSLDRTIRYTRLLASRKGHVIVEQSFRISLQLSWVEVPQDYSISPTDEWAD